MAVVLRGEATRHAHARRAATQSTTYTERIEPRIALRHCDALRDVLGLCVHQVVSEELAEECVQDVAIVHWVVLCAAWSGVSLRQIPLHTSSQSSRGVRATHRRRAREHLERHQSSVGACPWLLKTVRERALAEVRQERRARRSPRWMGEVVARAIDRRISCTHVPWPRHGVGMIEVERATACELAHVRVCVPCTLPTTTTTTTAMLNHNATATIVRGPLPTS